MSLVAWVMFLGYLIRWAFILTKTIKYSFLGGFITIDLVRDSTSKYRTWLRASYSSPGLIIFRTAHTSLL